MISSDAASEEPGDAEDEADAEWERTLAELDARAMAAEGSGDPSEIGPAFLAIAEHVAGVIDADELIELILTARDAYQRFDPGQATKTLQVAGAVANSAGDYEWARAAFWTVCEELSERDDPAMLAGAMNDFGALCTQLGDYDEADEALTAAIEIYDDLEMLHDAAEVRINLANNHQLSGRIAEAEQLFTDLHRYFGENSVHGATCLHSLGALYGMTGQNHLARSALEGAVGVLEKHGEEAQLADARMNLGWVLIACGETGRGEQLLAEQVMYFEEIGRPDKVAACEYNRANAAVMRGEFSVADNAFAAAAKGLAAAGLHHQLSRLQWSRVKRLTMEAAVNPANAARLSAEAVDTAIAAVIAADYERFQFSEPWRRARWRETLDHRITMTYAMCYSMGSASLTADLIELVLNAGVYQVAAASAGNVAAESLDTDFGDRSGSQCVGDGSPSRALTLGAAATLLSTDELPMAPPPTLVDGDGRVLLERQRRMAAELDPGLAEVLATSPRVQVW